MRQILLIAWREYKQYIFSRGFLLFLVMFPVGLVFMGAAIGFLEKNKPVRAFVVYDETGAYLEDIDRAIERRHLFDSIYAWDEYLLLHGRREALDDDLIPAPFTGDGVNDRRAQDFMKAGGFAAAQSSAAPYLKAGAPAFSRPRSAFERIALPPDVAAAQSRDAAKELLRPYLLEERLAPRGDGSGAVIFAGLIIPSDFGAEGQSEAAQYWSRNLTDVGLRDTLEGALSTALRRKAVSSFGLTQDVIDDISAIEAPFASFRPDKATDEAELGLGDSIETALPAVMTYMLLVIIFGVGNLLLTNTIEERSNKIVEVLLSSVTANQLMMGKLVGIGAVGLTMPAIFLFGGIGVAATAGGDGAMDLIMSALFSSNLLAIYLFYFFCAYLIFAMLFLAIGAVSNSLQDAQSYMGPVMLLVFAPLPFMLMVFQNPNGLVASILTWIPVYTPYAVMMRAASDPPLWEILGATALMLAFAIFLMRIMGRIFRQAILQAAPPKAGEVWRLAKGEAS